MSCSLVQMLHYASFQNHVTEVQSFFLTFYSELVERIARYPLYNSIFTVLQTSLFCQQPLALQIRV